MDEIFQIYIPYPANAGPQGFGNVDAVPSPLSYIETIYVRT